MTIDFMHRIWIKTVFMPKQTDVHYIILAAPPTKQHLKQIFMQVTLVKAAQHPNLAALR